MNVDLGTTSNEGVLPCRDDEPLRRVSTLAVVLQYVAIPLLIACGCVFVFSLVWWMTHDSRTPEDLLAVVRSADGRQRWQAAHEFTQRIAADPSLGSDPKLGRQVASLFSELQADDPPVAGFLARMLGQMAPEQAQAVLTEALSTKDASLRIQIALALARMGGPQSAPAMMPLLHDEDSGVRKAAAYAIGQLGGEDAIQALVPLLRDREMDVRWNATLGLAALGSNAGADVLFEMLDRNYLNEVANQKQAQGERGMTDSAVSEVMINAIRAAAHLKRPEFKEALERLRDEDESPRVQEAARLALRCINNEE